MLQFANVRKPVFVFSAVLAIALIAEFAVLEGTVGVSLPRDRNSAVSRLEIRTKGIGLHFITQNKRFTVVDLLTAHGSHREALVLRESFFMDREDGVEGPPSATVTVDATNGNNVRWTLHAFMSRGNAEMLSPAIYTWSLVSEMVRRATAIHISRCWMDGKSVPVSIQSFPRIN